MVAVVTAQRDKATALKLLKRIMKEYGSPHLSLKHRVHRGLRGTGPSSCNAESGRIVVVHGGMSLLLTR
jgi:hypothetical protein